MHLMKSFYLGLISTFTCDDWEEVTSYTCLLLMLSCSYVGINKGILAASEYDVWIKKKQNQQITQGFPFKPAIGDFHQLSQASQIKLLNCVEEI